ncbi:cytidylate kinase [candidate division KSB3 bacterium]|uniref:Cytidylate kinase n=1 Tax=candidate division KSB3 bacterium TaxID=2044937 RepID=A0A2G6KJ93_9BACT|nr:MAG: cytidylate kinase [candidate division KSB3 bacterium]
MTHVKPLIIAIDGPAGSGKSSIGDMLAERLDYIHLSTGSIYRAIGWKAEQHNIDFANVPALVRLIEQTRIEFERKPDGTVTVLLDGDDVSERIVTNEAGLLASAVSAIPEVRQGLLSLQRRAGEGGGVILDGRDIGTVVFPDADVKFYLDASVEVRAKRRNRQLQEQGIASDLEQLIHDIRQRDYDDSHRDVAPLRKADDAIYLDSTLLTREEVIDSMLTAIRKVS